MCGIVGCAGFIGTKEEKMFKQMLQLDVLRGKDSTGVAAVDTKGEVHVAKEAWLPQDFLESRGCKEIFKKNLKVLIGHNRAATVGAVNKAGAHPFEFDNIVGVHNGTTSKYLFKGHDKFAVDSEALYWHANNRGIADAWLNVSGAASLAFFDKQANKLALLRNKERPMEVVFSKDKKTMFFASEAWMLAVAAARSNVEIGKIEPTAVNHLYTFDPMKLPNEIHKFKTRAMEAYKAPSSNVTQIRGTGLNTTANSLHQLYCGQLVHFEFVRKEVIGQTHIAYVQSTSTPVALQGRVYLNPGDAKNDEWLASTSEFQGKISSVSFGGYVSGFTLDRTTIEELEDNPFGCLEEGIIFEGAASKVFTKEDFEKQKGVDNCCAWCSNPVDFDLLNFKGAGRANGMQQVVCDDCLNSINAEDIEGYVTLQDVYDISVAI